MSKKALWLSLPSYRRRKVTKPRRRFIPSITPKLSKERARYRRRVKVWLTLPENHWCRVYRKVFRKRKEATQCHHFAGRLGSLLHYEPYWVPVSAKGHVWIDNNRERARALGLLCPIGQWNKQLTHEQQRNP